MTAHNPETPIPDPGNPIHNDGAIDLSIYVDTLIRWWREIVLMAVLGAIGAGTVTLLLDNLETPTYEASSTAIMARVTSEVTLDERFRTLSETDANIDAARRAALTGLVRSGSIAAAVIEELGDSLPDGLQSTSSILEHIEANAVPSADSRTPSDLIRITASANSPETAAAIANSWLRHYVKQANALYGQVPAEVYDAVVAEQSKASANFAAAQKQLETFIGESRISSLNRQITERQALIDFLQRSRIDANVSILAQDVSLRMALFEHLSAAQVEPTLALLDEQTRQHVQLIADLFATRTRAIRQLAQARALQTQVEAGGDAAAASNAVALQLLKTQIFANNDVVEPEVIHLSTDLASNLPTSTPIAESGQAMLQPSPPLQWSIQGIATTPTADAQLQDVTALVDSLNSYIAELDEAIASIGKAVSDGDEYLFLEQLAADQFTMARDPETFREDGTSESQLQAAILGSYADLFRTGGLTQLGITNNEIGEDAALSSTIVTLEEEVQRLSAQLEAEQARERQLTQQRDLAWNTYDTLSNKTVELNLERTAANREVRTGTEATVPLAPMPGRSPLLAAVIGSVIGLLFGISLAFLMDYQDKQPFLTSRNAAS